MAAGRPAGLRLATGKGLIRSVVLLAAAAVSAGCAGLTSWDGGGGSRTAVPASGIHVVQPGQNLHKIAWRYGLDWRDLAAWNRLRDPSRIYPGQEIRLTPPGAPAASAARRGGAAAARPERPAVPPPSDWLWPAEGPLLWKFGESRRNPTGIGIGGSEGAQVRAVAPGEVVYSGGGLIGYGQLIILKHNDSYLSAYGHNRALRVKEGEQVAAGQVIALMGRGPGDRPLLHFEIRRQGRPVDPLRYLPPR
ncbi:MAG: peptidoglycan DD-metalloendopeptidase family protein [Gammaproteobacteria bacterium]